MKAIRERGTRNSEWMTIRLGDVVEIDRHGINSAKLDPDAQYLGLEHLDGEGDMAWGETVESARVKSTKFRFTSQHILFGKLRPYLRKVARPNRDGVCSTDILPLLPRKGFDKDFLFHLLRTDEAIQRATRACAGANLPRLSPEKFRAFEFRVPRSLPEQKRIAAILDKADGIRRKRQQALRLTDDFLRSVFLDMFGDPVTNPMGWKTRPFSESLENIDSGWSPKCHTTPAKPDEWGVLKLGAVTWCSYNEVENKALPSDLLPRPQNEVQAGDLLFCRKNTHDLVAAAAYVFETRPKLMIPDLIFRLRLRPDSDLHPIFLWYLLNEPHQKKVIQSLAGGAAGSMPNISKAKLNLVSLIRPPFDEQEKFATLVEQCRKIQIRNTDLQQESNTLFSSLQQRAFRGEL